ncbi:extracellular solute-binding protein [Streptosporangium sp. NPDC051022]|uniref:extracellular solute-binding protein n=1 Tax=Streptosporangium sp. NPDC051022 TaxID=3155752 RepID=UPI00343F9B4A
MSSKIIINVWLNHWFLWPELLDPVRRRAEEFGAAHPEYAIDIRPVDVRTTPREIAQAVERGAAPHVVAYHHPFTQEAHDARSKDGGPLFVPLEEAIGGREEILGEPVVIDDIVATVRNYYSLGGRLLSMPRNTSTILFYANMTLLEAAGVREVPRTWEEVEDACRAVAGLRDGPSHGITWANYGWFFQQAVAQQGGLLADHDNGRSGRAEKVDLTSPEMMAYVTWWHRLHRDGHYLYTGKKMDWQGTFDAFAAQRTAFLLNSSVETGPILRAAREAGFRVAVGRAPHNGRVPCAGNLIGGESLWLASGLDEATRDGALAFLQYLSGPRHPADMYELDRTFVPTTRTAVDRQAREGWFDRNPHFRVGVDQLDATKDSPATRGALFGDFSAIQEVTATAMHDVLLSGTDPADRFTRASAEAQRLLEEYNASLSSGNRSR